MRLLTGAHEWFFIQDILGKHPVVVQIGAFYVDLVGSLCENLPEGRVIVYEAAEETFNKLKGQEFSNLTLYNKAVCWDGDVSFEYCPKKPQVSSISTYCQYLKFWGLPFKTRIVQGVSLETVLKENNLDQIDVLLLDCEGAELGILREIMSKSLPVVQIHIEVDIEDCRAEWAVLRKDLETKYDLVTELRLTEPDPSPLFLFRRKA